MRPPRHGSRWNIQHNSSGTRVASPHDARRRAFTLEPAIHRHPLSLLVAAGFVGLFAATSQIPDFVPVHAATEVVDVTLDGEGEVTGEVLVTIDGLQEPLDSGDVELRVRVGSEDMPRWLVLYESEDWERRAKDSPLIGPSSLSCEPAPEPCEVALPFILVGRRDRNVAVPFSAELGVLQWGDSGEGALVEALDGATVRLEVVLD